MIGAGIAVALSRLYDSGKPIEDTYRQRRAQTSMRRMLACALGLSHDARLDQRPLVVPVEAEAGAVDGDDLVRVYGAERVVVDHAHVVGLEPAEVVDVDVEPGLGSSARGVAGELAARARVAFVEDLADEREPAADE